MGEWILDLGGNLFNDAATNQKTGSAPRRPGVNPTGPATLPVA